MRNVIQYATQYTNDLYPLPEGRWVDMARFDTETEANAYRDRFLAANREARAVTRVHRYATLITDAPEDYLLVHESALLTRTKPTGLVCEVGPARSRILRNDTALTTLLSSRPEDFIISFLYEDHPENDIHLISPTVKELLSAMHAHSPYAPCCASMDGSTEIGKISARNHSVMDSVKSNDFLSHLGAQVPHSGPASPECCLNCRCIL